MQAQEHNRECKKLESSTNESLSQGYEEQGNLIKKLTGIRFIAAIVIDLKKLV